MAALNPEKFTITVTIDVILQPQQREQYIRDLLRTIAQHLSGSAEAYNIWAPGIQVTLDCRPTRRPASALPWTAPCAN
jgi:hypothetical protein